MPGPKPKPTGLKVLEGNRGHQKLPKHEPKPRPITPDPPPYLGAVARRRWDELIPELELSGVITVVDGDVLGCYCAAYQDVCELSADVAEHGKTYEVGTNGAQSTRPEAVLLQKAKDDLRRFGAELGIGAASRTKVEVKKPDAGTSPLAAVREATQRRR
jgi:P27 family predicted phage terminase small subunit